MDNKNFLTIPRIIFAILGIIVLVELVYAVRVLTAPSPTPSLSAQRIASQTLAGRISLFSPRKEFKVNETVPVSVIVETGSYAVGGIDLIVRFDPKILSVTAEGLTRGKIMDEYPLKSVDQAKGLISISGISNSQTGFTGTGEFAVINFKAKTAGQTSLTIDFKKNTTTNSNLVEMNTFKNILDAVDNLEVVVQ